MILCSFSKPISIAIISMFFTSGSFRQSDIDCISSLELLHIPSSFGNGASTIIADFIRKPVLVNTAVGNLVEKRLVLTGLSLRVSEPHRLS